MSDIDNTVSSEDNTNTENTPEANATQEEANAEGAKISAILERLRKQNAEKDAEIELLKEQGTKTEAKPVENSTGLTREEAILFSQGLSEEEVAKAQRIALIEGVSVTEAIKDPIYQAWKTKREEAITSEKASVGTSTGSPTAKQKQDFGSKDLKREDHKALFKARQK